VPCYSLNLQPTAKPAERAPEPPISPAQRLLAAVLNTWDWLAVRRLAPVLYAVLALIATLVMVEAPHRTHRWAPDTFLFLDGGWRVYNGQRPYVDFYAALGPVTFQLVALGLWLGGVSAAAIDYGFGIAAIALGIWAWWLFGKRMESPAALLLALFVAVLTIAPHALGARLDILTYASLYNRLGYALVIIVLVEAVCAPVADSMKDEWAGGISSGAACLLLLFVKPSFFLIAVPMLAASYLFRDLRRLRRTLGLAVGFAIPAVLMLAYLRFDAGAIWYDFRTLAAARTSPINNDPAFLIGPRTVLKHAYDHAEELAGLLLLSWMAAILPRAKRTIVFLDGWWPVAAAAAVVAADLALNTGNGVQYSLPLIAAMAVVLVSTVFRWWRSAELSKRGEYRWLCGFSLVLGFALFAPQPLNDIATLAYSARQSTAGPALLPHFQAAPLRRLLSRETPPDWDEDPYNGKSLIDPINDGTWLIESASRPQESVIALSPVNPFSFALRRKPAEGGCPYLGAGFFNPGHMPPQEWMIGGADLLMVPKKQTKADAWLKEVFGDYVERKYTLAAQSNDWWLYRRTRPVTPASWN